MRKRWPETVNSVIDTTANFISNGMVERDRNGSSGVYNYAMSAWEGAGFLLGSSLGVRDLGEAVAGVDIITNQELSDVDRWTRTIGWGMFVRSNRRGLGIPHSYDLISGPTARGKISAGNFASAGNQTAWFNPAATDLLYGGLR